MYGEEQHDTFAPELFTVSTGDVMVPIGSIVAYIGTREFLAKNNPDYLVADGSTVPARQYKYLADALGVTGDTITLPDYTARFLKGADASGVVGKQGGSSTHSHTGSISQPTEDVHNSGQGGVHANSRFHRHNLTVDPSDHEPPYATVLWIIRVK
jgi:hypothetical protein